MKQLKEVKESKMKHFVSMQKGEYKALKVNYKKVLHYLVRVEKQSFKKIVFILNLCRNWTAIWD